MEFMSCMASFARDPSRFSAVAEGNCGAESGRGLPRAGCTGGLSTFRRFLEASIASDQRERVLAGARQRGS